MIPKTFSYSPKYKSSADYFLHTSCKQIPKPLLNDSIPQIRNNLEGKKKWTPVTQSIDSLELLTSKNL